MSDKHMNPVPCRSNELSIKGDGFFETIAQADGSILVQTKWISVKDRLPEKDTRILYVDARNDIYLGELMSRMGKEIYWSSYDFLEDNDITHWMPLPRPPKV